VELKPTKVPEVCDNCGGQLVQRADDREESIRRRLQVYHKDTEPLEQFYWKKGLLREVKAVGEVEEVTRRAIAVLSDLAAATA
jgi:adenylate kinase